MARTPRRQPELIDFFCGAGGFSEGFRQQGFKVVMGIDNWRPAIDTHNLNHHLADTTRDVLEFEDIKEIEKLPDTELIVGSPPCVLFSMSNKGGNADKTLGIRLIEAYLRVVAVKKHKRGSTLQAWFLENVPNSRKYIKPQYTFNDLGLGKWAKTQGKKPAEVALQIEGNNAVLNAADYGSPQGRQRFVCGEIFSAGGFIQPEKTHTQHRTLAEIRSKLPRPTLPKSDGSWTDPSYPSLSLPLQEITDHFYDSGVFEVHWMNARDYKLNHPYMGRMSFPENESRPSRTIMATKSASSRESLIYKSEYRRKGDGEYRTPTIREIACLMGFPMAYQFFGGETTKWAQIGNAVPTHLSAALARTVREAMGIPLVSHSRMRFDNLLGNHERVPNLNTWSKRTFENPPKRKSTARFRKHPFKDGNMTVALTNYRPDGSSSDAGAEWYSAVFYGTGKGFRTEILPSGKYRELERLLVERYKDKALEFLKVLEKELSYAFGNCPSELQKAYVGASESPHPTHIIDGIASLISRHDPEDIYSKPDVAIAGVSAIPARQLMAMYAINRVVSP